MNYGEIAGKSSMPIGVMIVGTIFMIVGIVAIVFGTLMLTGTIDQFLTEITQKYPELKPIMDYGAVIFVTGGLVDVIAGAGFFLNWKGSYYTSVIMIIASMIASIAFLFLNEYTVSDTMLISTSAVAVVLLIMLLCMFTYSTRSYFLD